MSKEKEEKILSQEVDDKELAEVQTGLGGRLGGSWGDDWGDGSYTDGDCPVSASTDADKSNCTQQMRRDIYAGKGFPNCAATVGDGSWCGSNDACFSSAVDYTNMKDCPKAWR